MTPYIQGPSKEMSYNILVREGAGVHVDVQVSFAKWHSYLDSLLVHTCQWQGENAINM